MDLVDRQLLDLLQRRVPLVPRPFSSLGHELSVSEEEVLSRTRRLSEDGVIRQIGAIFSSKRLGYRSTLVAFHVAPDRLDEVAAMISLHPGVSHNYSRSHHFNLWFTLTVPPDTNLEAEIARLAENAAVADYLNLPSRRLFKLGVHFPMSRRTDDSGARSQGSPPRMRGEHPRNERTKGRLTSAEQDVVRVLQEEMDLVCRPFRRPAARIGLVEDQLLEIARDLNERGVMRRFSAVLKHRRAGYTANGMGCWVIPDHTIEQVGRIAASFAAVSHCYERPAYPPRWPYNLFTMVHGKSREEVEATIARIHSEIGPSEHIVLYSETEYKKKRVRYFVEDETR